MKTRGRTASAATLNLRTFLTKNALAGLFGNNEFTAKQLAEAVPADKLVHDGVEIKNAPTVLHNELQRMVRNGDICGVPDFKPEKPARGKPANYFRVSA